MMEIAVQHVFIIGSKGIPGSYGGYETFVDKLTEYHQDDPRIKYHVACKGSDRREFEYHNARCFQIPVPDIGPAQAIYYDVMALASCCNYIKTKKIQHGIIYVLACRIGPFAAYFQKKIHRLGGVLYVNPDGHEWMRKKWSAPVRRYWKVSERLMVKHGDLIICDSVHIERYIQKEYKRYAPKTTFIAYGAETRKSSLADQDSQYVAWLMEHGLEEGRYYISVGRAVPENNLETMIREFMMSRTTKDFVIITTNNISFFEGLERKLHYKQDSRIKFVGTVYDQELLTKIRENAYGYLHGHSVGGTNPSLLEALGSTKLDLLFDIGFNREVAGDAALYWTKRQGYLAVLIDRADLMSESERTELGIKARRRIAERYSWERIAGKYKKVFNKTLRLS